MNTKIRNIVAATGLAGSMLVGGVGIAAAQSTSSTTPSTNSTAATKSADKSSRLTAALAPLVSAGTITQAQADAVVKALASADVGPGGRGGRGGGMGNHADTIAKALGISTAELQTAMQAGKTIAQVATEKGVAVQKVIDAYVAEEKAEHPEMSAADITARVTAMVNGQRPAGGPGDGMGRGMGRGHGGRGGQAGQGSTSNTTNTTVKATAA